MTITIFGLTGNIACGKSTVAKTFKRHHIPIVDADILARQLVVPGGLALHEIIAAFGSQYLQADSTLDRIKLGELVFANPHALQTLNDIMLLKIHNEAFKQFITLEQQGHNLIGYDAALIVENDRQHRFRPLIVVVCAEEIQVKRLIKRNNLTEQQAWNRIKSQIPSSEKVKAADYVITTDGTIEQSIAQTEEIIVKLQCI